jgi:TetR/AcrR family transcriptional repressor of nem operon
MARTKEYDIDETLHKAMEAFWRNGYEATSVQDLVDATGVNRFSLYSAFGSKEGVLQAALDAYRDRVTARMMAALDDPSLRGLDAIRHFFAALKRVFAGKDGGRGCLFINTAVEVPLLDAASRTKVAAYLALLEGGLLRRLSEAAAAGDIPRSLDCAALARSLVTITLGSGVLARSSVSRSRVAGAIDGALLMIDALAVK